MLPLLNGRPSLGLGLGWSSKLLCEPIANSAMKAIETHHEGIISEGRSLVAISNSERSMFREVLPPRPERPKRQRGSAAAPSLAFRALNGAAPGIPRATDA